MGIGALLGIRDTDLQKGEWQVFDEEVFSNARQGIGCEACDQLPSTYTNNPERCFLCEDSPRYRYVIDMTTKELYLNLRERDIQDRFCFIAAFTPLVGIVVAVLHVALTLLKVITFFAFLEHPSRPLADRAKAWGMDVFRLLMTPISLIVAEALAIYGMTHPKEGMKAWTTFGQGALGFKKEFFFNPFIREGVCDNRLLDHLDQGVVLRDFCPVNEWKEKVPEGKDDRYYFRGSEIPQMVQDVCFGKEGRLYFNDPSSVVRIKGIGMFFFTGIFHPITLTFNTVFRLFKIVTFYHFWRGLGDEGPYNLKGRVQHLVGDLLRVALVPLVITGLFLSAAYMWIRPLDGKKLYATLIRAEYGHPILEPCLQPGYHANAIPYHNAAEFCGYSKR